MTGYSSRPAGPQPRAACPLSPRPARSPAAGQSLTARRTTGPPVPTPGYLRVRSLAGGQSLAAKQATGPSVQAPVRLRVRVSAGGQSLMAPRTTGPSVQAPVHLPPGLVVGTAA